MDRSGGKYERVPLSDSQDGIEMDSIPMNKGRDHDDLAPLSLVDSDVGHVSQRVRAPSSAVAQSTSSSSSSAGVTVYIMRVGRPKESVRSCLPTFDTRCTHARASVLQVDVQLSWNVARFRSTFWEEELQEGRRVRLIFQVKAPLQ